MDKHVIKLIKKTSSSKYLWITPKSLTLLLFLAGGVSPSSEGCCKRNSAARGYNLWKINRKIKNGWKKV